MSVEIISQYGGFHYHINGFWDFRQREYRHKIIETGDTFKTERGAMRKVKRLMKRKKKEYREKHPKRVRTQEVRVKRCRLKPIETKNVWVQIIE